MPSVHQGALLQQTQPQVVQLGQRSPAPVASRSVRLVLRFVGNLLQFVDWPKPLQQKHAKAISTWLLRNLQPTMVWDCCFKQTWTAQPRWDCLAMRLLYIPKKKLQVELWTDIFNPTGSRPPSKSIISDTRKDRVAALGELEECDSQNLTEWVPGRSL